MALAFVLSMVDVRSFVYRLLRLSVFDSAVSVRIGSGFRMFDSGRCRSAVTMSLGKDSCSRRSYCQRKYECCDVLHWSSITIRRNTLNPALN